MRFTYLKIVGWGWRYLSTVLDAFPRYVMSGTDHGLSRVTDRATFSSILPKGSIGHGPCSRAALNIASISLQISSLPPRTFGQAQDRLIPHLDGAGTSLLADVRQLDYSYHLDIALETLSVHRAADAIFFERNVGHKTRHQDANNRIIGTCLVRDWQSTKYTITLPQDRRSVARLQRRSAMPMRSK
jgi:hypothetical protein